MTLINQLRLSTVKIIKRSLSKVKFRGKGTLLSFLCPKNEVIDIDLFGFVFRCDLSEWIQRSIFLYDYDEEAVQFIKKNLKKDDVFVDVGANVGFYSLLASSLVGEKGRVIAVEPNPKTYSKLKSTIERNAIPNILALNVGLGKEHGFLNLYSDSNAHNDSASLVAHGVTKSVQVEIIALDSIAQQHQIDKIAYVKIDVEGFEPDVLEGAKTLLAEGKIRIIQTEFNDYWLQSNGSSPQKLHNSLVSAGFDDVDGTPHFTPNCLVDRFFVKK